MEAFVYRPEGDAEIPGFPLPTAEETRLLPAASDVRRFAGHTLPVLEAGFKASYFGRHGVPIRHSLVPPWSPIVAALWLMGHV
eukprot:15469624-Alexandrium_andersonii.AAC.1